MKRKLQKAINAFLGENPSERRKGIVKEVERYQNVLHEYTSALDFYGLMKRFEIEEGREG